MDNNKVVDSTIVEEEIIEENTVNTEKKYYEIEAEANSQDVNNESEEEFGTTTPLVLGILSVALPVVLGWLFLPSIASIVLGAIALSKSSEYDKLKLPACGKMTAARVLGIIGLIFGIIATVGWIIFILGFGCVACFI